MVEKDKKKKKKKSKKEESEEDSEEDDRDEEDEQDEKDDNDEKTVNVYEVKYGNKTLYYDDDNNLYSDITNPVIIGKRRIDKEGKIQYLIKK